MTEELIRELKHVKNALVNKELSGDEWEEKQEMVKKLEDVTSYLKDALGQGIEFQKGHLETLVNDRDIDF